MCMYNASCNVPYGFCCDIDEDVANEIAGKFLVCFLACPPLLLLPRNLGAVRTNYKKLHICFGCS